jgi:Fe-S cluster assembly ATP-binding protein
MLHIENLYTRVKGKEILKNLTLHIAPGEVHAIMGPNGAGKTSLAKTLIGYPEYEIVSGSVRFQNQDVNLLSPEERASLGLFLSFQQPLEVPGVNMKLFLKTAYTALLKARGQTPLDDAQFDRHLEKRLESVGFDEKFLARGLHEGFSGGEKKKSELVQMALFDPALAILDEIDSGLDVDALKQVSKVIEAQRGKSKSLLLITHYSRLLDYVRPDFVHIMHEGKIVAKEGPECIPLIEEKGYGYFATRKR